jgi:hypothetical protein
MANEHIFNNNIRVTGSIAATGGFIGDGSGLSGIVSAAQWDGSHNGNADITGSLIVSGSNVVVDFTNTSAISGSTFSGSFAGLHTGNGSGLTNLNLNGYQLSGSNLSGSFSGSYIGDGSGLTGLNNFPFTGSAVITGSLLVSGSNTTVNFVDVAAISGSVFSGSFAGNGSGLTNLTATWNGTRLGDANITGSFIVSGSQPTISLLGDTIIDENILISNRNHTETISIGSGSLPNSGFDERKSLAIGYKAGSLLTSGSQNVFIGNETGMCAVRVQANTAVGYQALRVNTGPDLGPSSLGVTGQNTAVGALSLLNLQTGIRNTAIGYCSLSSTIAESGNIAVGWRAGATSRGTQNVFVGCCAGAKNSSGIFNVQVGAGTIGHANYSVIIGHEALKNIGAGNTNKSAGSELVAIGTSAGANASDNSSAGVYIGHRAGPSSTVVQSNQFYLHNSSGEDALLRGDFATGQLTINNQVSASIFSGSFVGDGSGLSGISGAGFPFNGDAVITGSLHISQSSNSGTNAKFEGGHVILTRVSESLEFKTDALAGLGGVPLGGLYRNGNFIQIRLK